MDNISMMNIFDRRAKKNNNNGEIEETKLFNGGGCKMSLFEGNFHSEVCTVSQINNDS